MHVEKLAQVFRKFAFRPLTSGANPSIRLFANVYLSGSTRTRFYFFLLLHSILSSRLRLGWIVLCFFNGFWHPPYFKYAIGNRLFEYLHRSRCEMAG